MLDESGRALLRHAEVVEEQAAVVGSVRWAQVFRALHVVMRDDFEHAPVWGGRAALPRGFWTAVARMEPDLHLLAASMLGSMLAYSIVLRVDATTLAMTAHARLRGSPEARRSLLEAMQWAR